MQCKIEMKNKLFFKIVIIDQLYNQLFKAKWRVSPAVPELLEELTASHSALNVSVLLVLCLQRSRSAFSLTSDDSPEKGPEEEGAGAGLQDYVSLKREGKATSLPTWKSVDRLDNSSKTVIH